jgi:hypothetical protein
LIPTPSLSQPVAVRIPSRPLFLPWKEYEIS